MTIDFLPAITAGAGLLIGGALVRLISGRPRRRAPAEVVPKFARDACFGPVQHVSWWDNERLRFLVVRDQITSERLLFVPEEERNERVTHWLSRWTAPV